MSDTVAQIPVDELIPMLTAIAARDWEGFKGAEKQFLTKYSIEEWEDFFAFRLKPALDTKSDRWLLIQWCSTGILSVKDVA